MTVPLYSFNSIMKLFGATDSPDDTVNTDPNAAINAAKGSADINTGQGVVRSSDDREVVRADKIQRVPTGVPSDMTTGGGEAVWDETTGTYKSSGATTLAPKPIYDTGATGRGAPVSGTTTRHVPLTDEQKSRQSIGITGLGKDYLMKTGGGKTSMLLPRLGGGGRVTTIGSEQDASQFNIGNMVFEDLEVLGINPETTDAAYIWQQLATWDYTNPDSAHDLARRIHGSGADSNATARIVERAFAQFHSPDAAETTTGVTTTTGESGEEAWKRIDAGLTRSAKHIQGTLGHGRVDMNRATTDPSYMQSLVSVADHVIEIPQGWEFTPPVIGPDGRVVEQATFQPVEAPTPIPGQEAAPAPQYENITARQQKVFMEILSKQWEAQDLLSRMSAADVAGKSAEELLAQRQTFQGSESVLDRAHQVSLQEMQNTVTKLVQGSFEERKTHEINLQEQANNFQLMSQGDQQTWKTSERQAAEKVAKEVAQDLADHEVYMMISGEVLQKDLARINHDANLAEIRLEHGNVKEISAQDHKDHKELQDIVHKANLEMAVKQGEVESGLITAQAVVDEKLQHLAYVVETRLQQVRDSGMMARLAEQLQSDAQLQGKRLSHEAAEMKAERLLKAELQREQLEHEVELLGEQGRQAMEQIIEGGVQSRLTLADEITSREYLAGNQISHEEAMQKADAELQEKLVKERGAQARQTAVTTGEQERETLEKGHELKREAVTTDTPIDTVRNIATNFTTTLNNAITTASTTGNYEVVNEALAQELPPLPSGIMWNREQGAFVLRPGHEGREMDADTRNTIAALTPAYKTRDRVEKAVQHANLINIELTANRADLRAADLDFSNSMMTGDIDSAEEAAARLKMAETASISIQSKMEHLEMLFTFLKDPMLLAQANQYGLLGQITAVLGFTVDNVPTGPSTGAGSVPNLNEWETMDSENKAFSLAAYVAKGGNPNEFLTGIAASSPAQMQQVTYGVL